jgi:hypothetical protein
VIFSPLRRFSETGSEWFGDDHQGSLDIIAYTAVLRAAQSFEKPPIFLKEDSEQITSDPELIEKVPEWMILASQVATRNRRRVLEDGPDKMNSDDEEREDMKPDEEANMYAPGMDPTKGLVMLSANQVAAQKAAAQALKALRVPPHSQSPVNWSSDEDDPNGSEFIWSQTKSFMRRNKHWKGAMATSSGTSESPTGSVNVGERYSGKVSSSSTAGKDTETQGNSSGKEQIETN